MRPASNQNAFTRIRVRRDPSVKSNSRRPSDPPPGPLQVPRHCGHSLIIDTQCLLSLIGYRVKPLSTLANSNIVVFARLCTHNCSHSPPQDTTGSGSAPTYQPPRSGQRRSFSPIFSPTPTHCCASFLGGRLLFHGICLWFQSCGFLSVVVPTDKKPPAKQKNCTPWRQQRRRITTARIHAPTPASAHRAHGHREPGLMWTHSAHDVSLQRTRCWVGFPPARKKAFDSKKRRAVKGDKKTGRATRSTFAARRVTRKMVDDHFTLTPPSPRAARSIR